MYKNEINGTFEIDKEGEYYCGMSDEREEFSFRVEIETDKLDVRGFVVDVRDVQEWVEDAAGCGEFNGLSGEMIADSIADAFFDSDDMVRLSVSIDSSEFSTIKVERKRPTKLLPQGLSDAIMGMLKNKKVDERDEKELVQLLERAMGK